MTIEIQGVYFNATAKMKQENFSTERINTLTSQRGKLNFINKIKGSGKHNSFIRALKNSFRDVFIDSLKMANIYIFTFSNLGLFLLKDRKIIRRKKLKGQNCNNVTSILYQKKCVIVTKK